MRATFRAALEACSLCTKESAAVKSATKSFNGYSGAAPEAHGFSFELRKKRRLLHCHSNSLAEFLSQQRSSVLEAAEKFRYFLLYDFFRVCLKS